MSQLAYPLGLSLCLCVLSLVAFGFGRRRFAAALVTAGVAWVGLWSLPPVSDALQRSLENRYPNQLVEQLPAAEVAIVLGGGITPAPRDWPYPDMNAAADRVWHAARLFHAGKAQYLLVSGRSSSPGRDRESESEIMRRFLVELGVPDDAILLEDRSHTTRENALCSAELLADRGFEHALLVTSALHMRRALGTFRAAGIDATPAPTDFRVMPKQPHLLRWLPNSAALDGSTRAMKEYFALWLYRWRGWAE